MLCNIISSLLLTHNLQYANIPFLAGKAKTPKMNSEYEIRDSNNRIFKNCSDTGYRIRDDKRIYKNCVFMGYEIRGNYIYGNGSIIFD